MLVSLTLTTTYVPNDNTEYLGCQWSIDGNLKSDANTHIYNVQVYSQSINVTCEVFVKLNNNGSVLNESVSKAGGKAYVIYATCMRYDQSHKQGVWLHLPVIMHLSKTAH